MGENFRVEIKVIPVQSQSEDSESEATEELEEARDDPDRTEGLDRRADPVNKTETQSENSETTPWDLPVMPAPDASDLSKKFTETREKMQWSRRFYVH